MTKDTGVPPTMYPTPSRRGGRGAAPGTVHHRPTPQFQQQRPAQPSSAAAKAAAAAKALHRRAQERAKTKQQQQQEEEKQRISHDNGQSSRPPSEQRNDVFRRSPNQEVTAEGQKAAGGSILKKMMTTGQSYRVGPAAEDVKYEAKPSSTSGKKSGSAASAQPTYPHGHPGAHYQHHPHMMYGHPTPYGHPHYPYAHPHYHHQDRQNSSTASNAKSNDEGADTSPKSSDPNNHHHYYAHNYHQGHQYPPHPSYYDGRNYSSYPHYHGQNPPHQFYNPYHRGNAPPPGTSSSANNAMIAEGGKSSKSSAAPSEPPLEEQPISDTARGSTRLVIGSHTSIHVPRESMMESHERCSHSPEKEYSPEKECLPSSTTPRNETIFRYGEDSEGRDLLESTEILLSLSKSFDRGDGNKHNHNTRGSVKKELKPKKKAKKAKKVDDAAAASAPGKQPVGERPKSPPRIHHFHKQTNVSTFEPQPSPVKLDPNDIELAPSFQLFNQSFDMNLENLLGPNASFGLGPMKSLSFGLGLPNPSDVGASPRASPMSIHYRMSPRVAADAAGVGHDDFGSGPAQPKLEDGGSNLQVLRASPSTSFGNVMGCGESQPKKDGSSSVIVLGDSARVGTLPAASNRQSLYPKKRKKGQMGKGNATKKTKDSPAKRKKTSKNIDSSLFEVLETHQSMFTKFSFLLPGAKAILDQRSRSMKSNHLNSENDEEVARRRINSALCAFGGVVIPTSDSIGASKSGHEQKYEDSLPDRYYEEENRLSWEIEENPPVELDYEEDGQRANNVEAKRYRCKSCGSTQRNHNCPKEIASLQRDIGVMVYPAVNAFTAAEPGIMTPALDEMNNFVDSPSRSTPLKEETKACGTNDQSLPLVSPDYVKTPQRSINYAGGAWMSNHQSPVNVTPGRDTESPTDLLFVDTQELLPEQYRIVNIKKRKVSSSQYVYPALPLPYGQRKRISNAMFAMSKSIPGLTDQCASVLSEARKKDAWDFAVAQLMTQVVVLTHCAVEDSRLDGLSKYLLTFGIAA